MSRIKKNKTFLGIIARIIDILVYPIIIVSFMSSFFMIVSKSKDVVSPIFGHTFARVLSNSMSYYCEEAGRHFVKGDVVILRTGAKMYNVGDIIAFYYYHDSADNLKLFDLTKYESKQEKKVDTEGKEIVDESGQPVYITNKYSPVLGDDGKVKFDNELFSAINSTAVGESFVDKSSGNSYAKVATPSNRKSVSYVQEKETPVYFHQIVQIKIDTSGTIFYITKGTANAEKDTYEIRQDFVVGKYAPTPKWFSGFVNFCASTEGMIMLVVVPIAIVVLVELLSILEQVNNIILEKKVINREIAFDTKECYKANIGIEMRNADKVFYYDVMPEEYKEEVFEYLWGYLRYDNSKKNKELFSTSQSALSVYEMKTPSLYYTTWKESFKSKMRKNQIDKAQDRAEKEKYANVAFVDYQNYLDDADKENALAKAQAVDKVDEVKEQEKAVDAPVYAPDSIEAKLQAIEAKLEKTKRIKNRYNKEISSQSLAQDSAKEQEVAPQINEQTEQPKEVAKEKEFVFVPEEKVVEQSSKQNTAKDIDVDQILKEAEEKLAKAKRIKNGGKYSSRILAPKQKEKVQYVEPENTEQQIQNENLEESYSQPVDIDQRLKEVEERLAKTINIKQEEIADEVEVKEQKPKYKKRKSTSKEIDDKLKEVESRLESTKDIDKDLQYDYDDDTPSIIQPALLENLESNQQDAKQEIKEEEQSQPKEDEVQEEASNSKKYGKKITANSRVRTKIDVDEKLKEVEEKLAKTTKLKQEAEMEKNAKQSKEQEKSKPKSTKKKSAKQVDLDKKLEEVENRLENANRSLKTKNNKK